jgi:hypothetical protein
MPTSPFLNENKFEHYGHYGTLFTADRCDFRGGVKVEIPNCISKEALMSDISEMVAYHAINIFPRLNGFQGYDCIDYLIKK